MLKVGMSSCAFDLTAENFKKLAEAGIKDIEISLPYECYGDIDHKQVKKYADEYGVNLWSYHLPFCGPWVCDIASPAEDIRRRAVDMWCDYIRKASEVGVDKFVAHPSSEPKPEDEERLTFINYAKENLDFLAEFAAKHGAVIAVEDLPRTCLGRTADELADLISVNDKLRICFDTNHLLIDDNISFVEKLCDKIVTTHVSDYFFYDECHFLPGEGKVDWHALYNKLIEKGYNGVWMYELGCTPPGNLKRVRNLEFTDFYNNAMEIMTGKPLTVIPLREQPTFWWDTQA